MNAQRPVEAGGLHGRGRQCTNDRRPLSTTGNFAPESRSCGLGGRNERAPTGPDRGERHKSIHGLPHDTIRSYLSDVKVI